MQQSVSDTGFAARQKSYELLVEKVESGKFLTPSEMTAMTRFEEESQTSGRDLPEVFATPGQVAAYTGYKVRTIYNAVKLDKLQRLADGGFARSEVDRYLATKNRLPQVAAFSSEGGQEDEPESNSARHEETRYRKARADKEELLVKRLRGEVVDVAEVQRQFTARAHEYKTSLLLLSRRCAHRIAAAAGIESKEVVRILDEEAKILLATLCRKVKISDD